MKEGEKNKKKRNKKKTAPQAKDLKAKGKAPMVPKSKGRKIHKDACLKCGELGHWARDCPILHGTSGSGTNVAATDI
ncbi:hypothetical protein OROHE_013927 [Orobanche hederae]